MCSVSSRASGGTLAAFLFLAAIVGFAGGAYLGTQSSGEASGAPNASPTSPPDAATSGTENDGNTDEEEASPDSGLTLTTDQSAISAGERIDYSGTIEPAEEGVELQMQRSIDGGDWTPFPEDDPITPETNADGGFSGYLQTGRTGENSFRVVRLDDESVMSEPVTVTIE